MTVYRTHHCGQLRLSDLDSKVCLSGWIQRVREMGGMVFIDLRDRYGITQIKFDQDLNPDLMALAKQQGRESVLQVKGKVIERSSKNKNIDTGDIEIEAESITVLNPAKTPPFTIEDDTDGGDDIALILEANRHHPVEIVDQPDRANGWCWRNGVADAIATRGFVIQADIARHDWHIQRRTRRADALHGPDKLPHDRRLFRVAEIEIIRRCQGLRTHC